MNAADGTKIAERWKKLYSETLDWHGAKIDTGTYKSTAELRMLIEELSAAEERERVLREALEQLRDCDWVISLPDRMDAVRDIARAALATPAPEQPSAEKAGE